MTGFFFISLPRPSAIRSVRNTKRPESKKKKKKRTITDLFPTYYDLENHTRTTAMFSNIERSQVDVNIVSKVLLVLDNATNWPHVDFDNNDPLMVCHDDQAPVTSNCILCFSPCIHLVMQLSVLLSTSTITRHRCTEGTRIDIMVQIICRVTWQPTTQSSAAVVSGS